MAGTSNVARGRRLTFLHTANIGRCVSRGVPTLGGVSASCHVGVGLRDNANNTCHHVAMSFVFISTFWGIP